jgi:glutamate-1-semialdehyde 2,1-aminomutase
VEAIQKQAGDALTFGAPTENETAMAEKIKQLVPQVELVRLVNSGTEACMSALRLARGYTGRNKFIKFEGCYHGHADPFLVKAGSGVTTFNIQTIPGVTSGTSEDTLIAPFNDLGAIENLFSLYPGEIAAIILEPVAGNMGCIPPVPGYLEGVRKLCTQNGALLIFDEVMTGFRLAPGGAQERFRVEADLVTYGKIIGGGLPMGAFGGKKEIMEWIAPVGNVYQAGTLSGNPLTVAAGLATLTYLQTNRNIYEELEIKTHGLKVQMQQLFDRKSIPVQINCVGSMISVHFSEHPIQNLTDASKADLVLFNRFFHHLLQQGIYLPPSAFESWFISIAIQQNHLDQTFDAIEKFNA